VKKIILSAVAALVVFVGATLLLLSYYQDEVPPETSDVTSEVVLDETVEDPELSGVRVNIHNHFIGEYESVADYELAIDGILQTMEAELISKMVLMPQPYPDDEQFLMPIEMFAQAIAAHPDQLSFFAGGESLNKMIQASSGQETVDQRTLDIFEARAKELVELGAIGFGEMTALHFSLGEGHPFEEVAPDNQLFLTLADLAAEYGIPIDIHMEAVPEDMDFPWSDRVSSKENPDTLTANIDAFERLLDYNLDAKIIWSHAGWGNTGERTPALMGKLLSNHDNLFMSIKIGPDSVDKTRPMNKDGELKSDWLSLLKEFPDRFSIGSDKFYAIPDNSTEVQKRNQATDYFLSLLPEDLAYQITVTNPSVLFEN